MPSFNAEVRKERWGRKEGLLIHGFFSGGDMAPLAGTARDIAVLAAVLIMEDFEVAAAFAAVLISQ